MKHPFFKAASAVFLLLPRVNDSAADGFAAVQAISCAPSRPDVCAVIDNGVVRVTMDGAASWAFRGHPPFSLERAGSETIAVDDEIDEETDGEDPGDDFSFEISESTDEVTEVSSSPTFLVAVDDEGAAAYSDRRLIAFSSAPSGAWRAIHRQGEVRAIAFDKDGRLFAIVDSHIICFDIAGERMRLERLAVQSPISLFRGREGRVCLLTRSGIFSIEPVEGRLLLKKEVPFDGGKAAAVLPQRDDSFADIYLIARGGRVVEIAKHQRPRVRIVSSESIEELAASPNGEIRYRSRSGEWHAETAIADTLLPITHAAIDAVGRIWETGPAGLRIVPAFASHIVLSSPMGDPAKSILLQVRALPPVQKPTSLGVEKAYRPQPPRCRIYSINPLPEIALSFASDRRATLKVSEDRTLHLKYGVIFGAQFTWRIGLNNITACRRRHERYRTEEIRLSRRNADLSNLLRKEKRRASRMRTLKEAVEAHVSVSRVEALLNVVE